MSEPTEIIEVDDHHRIVVYVDEDADCPRHDWDMLTGFVRIPYRGDSRLSDVPSVWPDEFGIEAAHERMSAFFSRARRLDYEPIVERWARVFRDAFVEYDDEHGGYWFVAPKALADNWPDLVPGSPESLAKQADVIKSEREVYRAWAEGEVYGVVFQKRVDLYELDDLGIATDREALTVWDDVEALWGCYLDETYTPLDVAKEMLGSEYTDKLEALK